MPCPDTSQLSHGNHRQWKNLIYYMWRKTGCDWDNCDFLATDSGG